jgi:Ser/Thr protein kinase RdoA (MazF antagonist)
MTSEQVFSQYNLIPETIHPFGTGLIHKTWLITSEGKKYILQKINHEVFKQPHHIEQNIRSLSAHLKKTHPEYFFVTPAETTDGKQMLEYEGEFYRLFPFVENSVTYDSLTAPTLAREAARQFALFTKNLSAFPLKELFITLPRFHDLSFRYEQFEMAIQNGDASRIRGAADQINWLKQQKDLTDIYKNITQSKEFMFRVTHHDTKISNVLFKATGQGICVIDLDTVMPGFFISDVGDMMRTYLSAASEEEKDFSKINIREEYFSAIISGYWNEMKTQLTPLETAHFVYAGKFIMYMQALRFMTDHLNLDRYYGAAYEGQNYNRAVNQATLLSRYQQVENHLRDMTLSITGVTQI